MRIYVDMDNTLYDMATPFKAALEKNPEIAYPQSQYGFFTKLELIPGAKMFLERLALKHDVWIATRPSFENPLCYTEKRISVEETLGKQWVKKLIMIPDKSLLIGDILIDDTPWPGFQGTQILFGSTDYPTWGHVYYKYFVND